MLVYLTYYKKGNETKKNQFVSENNQIEKNAFPKNSFDNVEYSGVDLNGNRYVITSEKADFELEKPELINMKIMNASFYFKDGTILKVKSDYGTYNNKNFNMSFRKNIKTTYNENILYSDNLDYSNSNSFITMYGNIIGESVQGNIVADKLDINLLTKTLDISMYDEKQIDILLRNKK